MVGETAVKTQTAKEEDYAEPEFPSLADTLAAVPAGKRFCYWKDSSGAAVDMDDLPLIVEDMDYTAVLVDQDTYDELAASTNNVFATDFTTGEADPFVLTSTSLITAENKLRLNTGNISATMDEEMTASGIYTAYFEVTPHTVGQAEAFFQVIGKSISVTDDGKEIFGVRSYKVNNVPHIGCRVNLSSTDIDTGIEFKANNTYKILVVVDMSINKASLSVNGTVVVENIAIDFTSIAGMKFSSKGANSDSSKETPKSIDNVVFNFEAKAKDELALAKEEAIATVDAYLAGSEYAAYDPVIQASIDDEAASCKNAIQNASDVSMVSNKKNAWNMYTTFPKHVITVEAYLADGTATNMTPVKYCWTEGYYNEDFTEVAFLGYNVLGVYKENTFATEIIDIDEEAFTANTTVYAKVEVASTITSTFTAVASASDFAKGWTLDNLNTGNGYTYRANQADGDSSNPTSGNYNAYQLFLKAQDNKDGRLTYTVNGNTKSIVLNITGWTGAGGSVQKDVVAVKVYDKDGTLIETVEVWTTSGKNNGSFTDKAENTDITITESSNIGKIEIATIKDGKSIYLTSATVTYSVE